MSDLGNWFGLIVGVNLVLLFAQMSIDDMNPNANVYVNCSSSILSIGGCSQTNVNGAFGDDIPTANVQGNGFTDIFNAISTWFKSGLGSKILGYIFALYPLLAMTGLTSDWVVLIGSAWYLLTFFSAVEWWRGIS